MGDGFRRTVVDEQPVESDHAGARHHLAKNAFHISLEFRCHRSREPNGAAQHQTQRLAKFLQHRLTELHLDIAHAVFVEQGATGVHIARVTGRCFARKLFKSRFELRKSQTQRIRVATRRRYTRTSTLKSQQGLKKPLPRRFITDTSKTPLEQVLGMIAHRNLQLPHQNSSLAQRLQRIHDLTAQSKSTAWIGNQPGRKTARIGGSVTFLQQQQNIGRKLDDPVRAHNKTT